VWSVDLRLDRPLVQQAQYLVVAGSAIQAVSGTPMASPPNDRGQAPGIVDQQVLVPIRPRVVSNGVDLKYDVFEGAYAIDSRGDIDVETADLALKKRILRRLVTGQNGFYHLPGYGLGIQLKKLLRSTDRAMLRNSIIRQLRQESDITDLLVAVDLISSLGFVQISIQASTSRQTSIGVQIRVGSGNSVQVQFS
jgi:hypothetical protein